LEKKIKIDKIIIKQLYEYYLHGTKFRILEKSTRRKARHFLFSKNES